MESELQSVIGAAAVVTPLLVTVLVYLFEGRLFNALLLGVFTGIACGLCALGLQLGGTVGLLVAIVLAAILAHRLGRSFGKRREHRAARKRGGIFVPALWLGFCASFAVGHWAAGPMGLFTITLPSIVLFWVLLYAISGLLLPRRDHCPWRDHWSSAFRALVSFSLGMNLPYYALVDREIVEVVQGNPFGQFFAGLGIVLSDAAHVPVIWDGLSFKQIGNPGLTFTGRFDQIYQTVDLRPQLRSFHVDAITKDGINIRILTFIPFRLNTGGLEPRIGNSFPVDRDRIYQAVWRQPVEAGKPRPWDQVVPIIASRILRRIISEYHCDELCETQDPSKDPRVEIRDRLLGELRRELVDYEIELIGGGISNLVPTDSAIIAKRIEAWRAEWERKIAIELGEGQANAVWEVETAYAQSQAALISAIQNVVRDRPDLDPEVLSKMAALRFIEALEDMACLPQVQDVLPDDTASTIGFLRRVLG